MLVAGALLLPSVGCPSDPVPSVDRSLRPDSTPPLAVRTFGGTTPGPRVALVAGVHGGKVSAMRALQRLAVELEGATVQGTLRGTVLLVETANAAGYAAGLAQLSPLDSLNLNRVFPGRADGRPTERLAALLMREIVAQSDYLIDLHGSDGDEAVGAFAYVARPGLDSSVDARALHLAQLWGTPRVVWDTEGPRTVATSRFLQTAAHLSGVPAMTVFESGAAREEAEATAAFLRGARNVLTGLGVLTGPAASPATTPAAPVRHDRRVVVSADSGAHWLPAVRPGQTVATNELLGHLVGSSGSRRAVNAPSAGVVLHVRKERRVEAATPIVILADGRPR